MKRALKNMNTTGLYHFVDGVRIAGAPSGLWGDVSGLRGDVSGLLGDVSGLWGDVDECSLTDEEREKGVDASTLVEE